MIRIVIVDNDSLFREGLRALLTAQGWDVVGDFQNRDEAIKVIPRLAPDAVLMGIQKPPSADTEAIRRVAALPHPPCIIAVSASSEEQSVLEAIRAGAFVYLLRDTPSNVVVDVIALAVKDQALLAPAIAAIIVRAFARLAGLPGAPAPEDLGLSKRQLAVLRELAKGFSNRTIATTLRISEGTVKNHLTTIFAKLHVEDRTQAALVAHRLRLR